MTRNREKLEAMNKISNGTKELIGIAVFFIIDCLLLMGMFYVCSDLLSIQSSTWKIIISNVVATPISYFAMKKIMSLF